MRELFEMEGEKDNGKQILSSIQNSLIYNHLSFSYPSNDREILKDISFEIKK
jgi:ABC-type bacteriocin/lantibiotic exporter with double-glycine peptidase domain